MEVVDIDTLKSIPAPLVADPKRKACLVHIYPPGPGIGSLYSLGQDSFIVGRGEDCSLRIDDMSVSRNHARIQPGMDDFLVIDLRSTNSTFVNELPVSMHKLQDGDSLRFGNQIFRFLTGDNVETHYHEELFRLSIIDGLTGIHNKRYLLEFLERELGRSTRSQRPLALILFDLDRFKAVNDRLGHLGGDYTLKELIRRVQGVIRKEELLARYGGEEFAVVLPETTPEGALETAERLRQLVEKEPFHFDDQPYPVTISLGVIIAEGDASLTPEDLIRQADEKLYEAKLAGRNCVKM